MNSDPQALARKILLYSRRFLTQRIPLLLAPLYALQEEPCPIPAPLATDGSHLWFHPEQVIQDFQKDRTAPARQLLHITLHCLLGHLPLRLCQTNKTLFDAAADWKVEQFVNALDPKLSKYGFSLYSHSSHSLYSMLQLLQDEEARDSFLENVRRCNVRLDDHNRWSPEQPAGLHSPQSGPARPVNRSAQDSPASPNWTELLQNLSHQVQNGSWGSLSGLLQMELEPTEPNQISYADFLKRFAAPQERLLLDPDSFDPRWYYLGLEQYGDIPLLEPSELSEPPAPDDLVIALDTSGSCSGDVCRRFLRETMSLLRDISAGAAAFRVLLLQCDTQIQQELLLESSDQIETLLADFTPKGFGGTDFRPVFQHVAQRQADGTLPRVRGLLYLSDGFGDFPDTPPDYPVTFLILQEDCTEPFPSRTFCPFLPDWCSVLSLNINDFRLKEASA